MLVFYLPLIIFEAMIEITKEQAQDIPQAKGN